MARKILLADDSVTAQNMGRKILADAGYEVIAVNNGSAALKKIAELKPDLVILDVYMPGYSGLEVCQRLKESQETSRVPVLLSVGKLEPFKPEEAQRVRADGYIVKPFEASELLSALSKLEDKVVPRSEPSKPGRFARAMAKAEESSRGSGNAAANEQNSWKSRINFPHEKTQPEPVADESPIYNPMNRDLRTVVATSGEKAMEDAAEAVAGKKEVATGEKTKEETRHQGETVVAETSVDVAALAPAGLPQDVTPEEVAAIAAAAAQLQMAGAALKDQDQPAEAQAIHAEESRIASQPDESGSRAKEEVPEPVAESKIENVASAAPDHRPSADAASQDQDEPVTMAASTGQGRWAAVPVVLEGEEATISLEQEMQKAYAAFAAAEANAAPVSMPEAQAASTENSSVQAQAGVEEPVTAISHAEPRRVLEPEPAVSAEAASVEPAPVAQSEAAVISEAAVFAPVTAAPLQASAETSATSEFTSTHEPPVDEFMSPVSEAEVAGLAGIVGLSAETQLGPEPEAAPEAAAASQPVIAAAEPVAEEAPQTTPDPEAVKSTAAAWASWRQIRDTGKSNETATAQSNGFDVPQSTPAEAARAVAAGAEQNLQEAQAAAPGDNPADVASIVDSVLADLRPKLMAEISRKMSEKK